MDAQGKGVFMADDLANHGNAVGGALKKAASDVFSVRADWVHNWIATRGLPFVAFAAFLWATSWVLFGDHEADLGVLVWVAGAAAAALTARLGFLAAGKHWQEMAGSYRLTTMAGLLLLVTGHLAGTRSVLFWMLLLLPQWGLSLLLVRGLLINAEYIAFSLFVAALVHLGYLPGADLETVELNWLAGVLIFAPGLVLAFRQQGFQRIALILTAIIVSFLIVAEIEGGWIVLGLIGAGLFLWLAATSLKRLARDDVSDLVYSFGFFVISLLIAFVGFGLLGLDFDGTLAWWILGSAYLLGGAVIVRRADSSALLSGFGLWAGAWFAAALVSVTDYLPLEDSLRSLASILFVLAIAAAGRLAAKRLVSGFLLAVARLWLLLACWGFYVEFESISNDLPLWAGLVIALLFLVLALWAAISPPLPAGTPWWRGVVKPRAVAVMRRSWRDGQNRLAAIPLIGPLASAAVATMRTLARLKKAGRTISLEDLAVLAVLFASASAFVTVGEALFSLGDNGGDTLFIADERTLVGVSVIYGLLLCLYAGLQREPMYGLAGMAAFVAAPFFLEALPDESLFDRPALWLTVLTAAVCAVMCRDLVIRSRR